MFTIFPREVKSFFQTTIGYIFMAIYLLLFGVYFVYLNINPTPNNAYTVTIENMVFIFVLLAPLLTMKSLSEERKNKTDQLLFTSPKSIMSIILGKYFAAVFLFFITLFITMIYPFLLSLFGNVHLPTIFTAYIGFFSMGCTFIALGIFISSLTENQMIAGIGTLGISMMIWLIDSISDKFPVDSFSGVVFAIIISLIICLSIQQLLKNIIITVFTVLVSTVTIIGLFIYRKTFFEGLIKKFSNWISIPKHSRDFYLGILNVSDLFYFISFIFIFLYLTIVIIERRRWA